MWDRPFSPNRLRIESFPYVFPGCLVGSYLPGVVYLEILNVYRKFKFIGNFKLIPYFVSISGPHFRWLEFHINIHVMAGKHVFSAQKAEKVTFLKL